LFIVDNNKKKFNICDSVWLLWKTKIIKIKKMRIGLVEDRKK
jgi:hypothetical protein